MLPDNAPDVGDRFDVAELSRLWCPQELDGCWRRRARTARFSLEVVESAAAR